MAAPNITGRSDVPETGQLDAMTTCMAREARVDTPSQCTEHNGYFLKARANLTNRDMYAADLVIERPGYPSRHFHALDHFYDAGQALRYATRWGRIWVDHQLKKIAGQENRFDCPGRQS
ncbi:MULTISPECIES: hypothetical protein [Paraburkholderia]|uniref:hypothetical protein n=1 Tax=Paraburkholderia TaxID=1822464 RepID=UPI001D130DE6|nr:MULTISPECIES: hypothetical protein [Paraburkholderia]